MRAEKARFQLLVVDDDIHFRDFLSSALMELGHEVMMVSLAKQALNLVRNIPFDLVIVDGVLPDGDGISLIEQIRASNRKTRLLFLSARSEFFTNRAIVHKLRHELAVDKAYQKPIDTSTFLFEVNALLSTHEKVESFDALELVEVLEEEVPARSHIPIATARPLNRRRAVPESDIPSAGKLKAILDSRRSEYAKKLRGTLMEMVQLCRHSATWTPQSPALQRVHQLAHNLHGSASVYGFPNVGRSCAQLEALLQEVIQGKRVSSLRDKIELCLGEAGRAFRTDLQAIPKSV